jgi:hypothetical protein
MKNGNTEDLPSAIENQELNTNDLFPLFPAKNQEVKMEGPESVNRRSPNHSQGNTVNSSKNQQVQTEGDSQGNTEALPFLSFFLAMICCRPHHYSQRNTGAQQEVPRVHIDSDSPTYNNSNCSLTNCSDGQGSSTYSGSSICPSNVSINPITATHHGHHPSIDCSPAIHLNCPSTECKAESCCDLLSGLEFCGSLLCSGLQFCGGLLSLCPCPS